MLKQIDRIRELWGSAQFDRWMPATNWYWKTLLVRALYYPSCKIIGWSCHEHIVFCNIKVNYITLHAALNMYNKVIKREKVRKRFTNIRK